MAEKEGFEPCRNPVISIVTEFLTGFLHDIYGIDTLKNLGFDDWFASYLLGVRYMSTKALSVMELKYIILLTWYQTYYPKQYAEVIGDDIIW